MRDFFEFRESMLNEDIAYHKKAIAHHDDYAKSHAAEIKKMRKKDHHPDHRDDHAAAEEYHSDAAIHHQKAHDTAKKHGTNSSQYKNAAKNAHTMSQGAHKSHTEFEATTGRDHPSKNFTIPLDATSVTLKRQKLISFFTEKKIEQSRLIFSYHPGHWDDKPKV